jgi:hypothetical protein
LLIAETTDINDEEPKMKVSKFKENSRNSGIFDETLKPEPPKIVIDDIKPVSKPPTHRRIISASKFKGNKKKYS